MRITYILALTFMLIAFSNLSLIAKNKNEIEVNIDDLEILSTLDIKPHFKPFQMEIDTVKHILYLFDIDENIIFIINILTGNTLDSIKVNESINYYFHKQNDKIWETIEPSSQLRGLFKDVCTNRFYMIAQSRKGYYDIAYSKSKSKSDTVIIITNKILIAEITDSYILDFEQSDYISDSFYFGGYDALKCGDVFIYEYLTSSKRNDKMVYRNLRNNTDHTFLNIDIINRYINANINPNIMGFLYNIDLENIIYYSVPEIPPLKISLKNDSINYSFIHLYGKLKESVNLKKNHKDKTSESNYFFKNSSYISDNILFLVNKKNSEGIIENLFIEVYDYNLIYKGELIISNNKININDAKILGEYNGACLILIQLKGSWKLLKIPFDTFSYMHK